MIHAPGTLGHQRQDFQLKHAPDACTRQACIMSKLTDTHALFSSLLSWYGTLQQEYSSGHT